MDDLTYGLRLMCRQNRDGSQARQADRLGLLILFARQLREDGFRHMQVHSLKTKHVQHLVQRWQAEGLEAGTIKNRMADLRWWAIKIGKAGLIPKGNAQLGIDKRTYVVQPNRAKVLEAEPLEKVTDDFVRLSLKLQQAFGLRREEAIKFQPSYADQGDHLRLKPSWCKGGKGRTVPIRHAEQRRVLDEVHQLAKDGSLIPAHKSYKQQLNAYKGQCKKAGLSNMHGLRHAYAQTRYRELTGWKAPKAGGLGTDELSPEQWVKDRMARQTISRELGHERLEVTAVYLGTFRLETVTLSGDSG